jgi:hypothetical protein
MGVLARIIGRYKCEGPFLGTSGNGLSMNCKRNILPVVIVMYDAVMYNTVVNHMMNFMVILGMSGLNGDAERKNNKKRKQNLLHRVHLL